MDDTICDYELAYKMNKLLNPGINYPQSQYGFFRSLSPIDGALEALEILSTNNDVWILTRPSVQNLLCYTEKAEWIKNHLGEEWLNKLIICPDKSLVLGDYLIDDCPWLGFKGQQIMFNKNTCNWSDTLSLLNEMHNKQWQKNR